MKLNSLITTCVVAAVVASTVSGCSGSRAGYYDTICVDPATQIRMPDYYCTTGAYYHPGWVYYVPYGYQAPAYGVHVAHYNVHQYSRPASATIHTGGVPPTGGRASKYSTGNVSVPTKGGVSTNKPSGSSTRPKSRSGGTGSRVGVTRPGRK